MRIQRSSTEHRCPEAHIVIAINGILFRMQQHSGGRGRAARSPSQSSQPPPTATIYPTTTPMPQTSVQYPIQQLPIGHPLHPTPSHTWPNRSVLPYQSLAPYPDTQTRWSGAWPPPPENVSPAYGTTALAAESSAAAYDRAVQRASRGGEFEVVCVRFTDCPG